VAAPHPSHSARTAPPLLRFPGGPRMVRTTACGPALPPVQVRARATGRPATGLQLLVGGGVLQRVDFDSGRASRLRHLPQLRPDEWFNSLTNVAGRTYATTDGLPCDVLAGRVLAVQGDRTTVVPVASASGIVSDESRAWVLRDPPHVLTPLGPGKDVSLIGGFAPVAATRGLVVGNLLRAMDPNEIVAVDARSGQLHATPGAIGSVVAVGHGRVFWTAGCTPDSRCMLLSAPARGGSAHPYRLAAPPAGSPGLLSPDGRYLALVVDHVAAGGPARSPALGGDVALLDLHTGRLRVVPGLELSTRYRPSFAFAPGGWLVVGYAHDDRAQLVAWRPGLADPVRSPFRATSPAAPPIAVVPAG